MMMNDGVDDEIEDSSGDDSVCFRVWFVLFCFVWFPLGV